MDQPAAATGVGAGAPSHRVPSSSSSAGLVRPDTAPAGGSPLTADSLAISVEVESHHGATCNIVLHLHSDGGRRKKQIKFPVDFKSDTSMSLAGELVASLHLPDPERTQMRIASAMEAKIQPVRKQYFAQIIAEETTGREGGEAQQQQQQQQPAAAPSSHQSRSNLSRNASFPSAGVEPRSTAPDSASAQNTTPSVTPQSQRSSVVGLPPHQPTSNKQPTPTNQTQTNGSRPMTGAGDTATISPQKAHAMISRTASQPIPNVQQQQQPAQQTQASHLVGGPLPPPTFDVRAVSSSSYTPQSGPQRSATAMAGSLAGSSASQAQPNRPGTSLGNRSTLPLNFTTPPTLKQTTSLPLNDPFAVNYAHAQAIASHQQAALAQAHANTQNPPQQQRGQGVAPPQSPPEVPRRTLDQHTHAPNSSSVTSVSPSGPCASCASGLLTLADFDSSEAYDAYLLHEISSLSVGQLKERLRGKPGGADLLKACFEKQDMVQLLIRVMGQEACTKNPTLPCGHCAGPETKQQQQQQPQQQGSSAHASSHSSAASQPSQSSHSSYAHAAAAASSSASSSSSSFSGHPQSTPDFLSPEPMSGSAVYTPIVSPQSTRIPPTSSAAHSLQASPDPFQGLDVLMGTPSPITNDSLQIPGDQRYQPHQHHRHQTHHMHRSLDSNAGSPNGTLGSVSTDFPFSPHGPFSNHSSEAGSAKSVHSPVSNRLHSPDGGLVSPHAPMEDEPTHAHVRETTRAPRVEEDPANGTFDFQVSITSPASSPDMGLDTQEPPPDFMSPTAAATTNADRSPPRHHRQNSLNSVMEDAESFDHAENEPTSSSSGSGGQAGDRLDDESQPSRRSRHDDLFSPSNSSSTGNVSSSGSKSSSAKASPVTSPSRHRHSAGPHFRQPSLDPELNAFFAQPRKTDLLVPNSGHHLIPGSAALHQHHEKQRAIAATKTAPADLWPISQSKSDFPSDAPTRPTVDSGISATGTKAQRSFTTPDLTTFDPLFFTDSNEAAQQHQQHHHHHQTHSVSFAEEAAAKPQRTRSEADQQL